MSSEQRAEKYLRLIASYTDGEMPADEFMAEYLRAFKDDYRDEPADEPYELLEPLFFAAEVYCDDPALRSEDNIGEAQFFKEAAYARRDLEQWLRERDGTE